MRQFLLLTVALLIPATALAQPGNPPPPPPSGPMGPPPPPPGNGYAPPVYAAPASSASLRNGMTFEANLGFGYNRYSADGGSSRTSDISLAGADIGIGAWASPNLAITVRINGVSESLTGGRIINGILGGNAQYWVDDHIWVGGGAGIGVLAAIPDSGSSDSVRGFALNGRAGYTFSTASENTFNASVEITPAFYSQNGQSATVTSFAVLLGYQHL